VSIVSLGRSLGGWDGGDEVVGGVASSLFSCGVAFAEAAFDMSFVK
jgi:hypothetical protein